VIYAAAFLAVLFFVLALELSGVLQVGARAIQTSRSAAASMRNPTLSDEDKERRMQQASLTLVRSFVSIGARSLAAVAAALLPLLAFEVTGLARFTDVTGWLATWEAIVLTTVIVTVAYYLRHKY
jgi:sterol desaturase/sphingolipid hydroxylase (fatty acid hydroxylase superfamily)